MKKDNRRRKEMKKDNRSKQSKLAKSSKTEFKTNEEIFFEEICLGGPEDRLKAFGPLFLEIVAEIERNKFLEVFSYFELAPGQINCYAKNEDAIACVVSDNALEERHECESVTRGIRVFPPEILLSKTVKISIRDIAQRKYSRIEEMKKECISSLNEGINSRILSLLTSSAKLGNNIIFYRQWYHRILGFFNKNYLITKLYKTLKDLNDDYIICLSSKTREKFRYLSLLTHNKVFIESLERNIVFGKSLIVIDAIPENEIFIIEKKNVGSVACRNFTFLPADQFVFGYPSYGYMIIMQLAMHVSNVKNVYKMVLK